VTKYVVDASVAAKWIVVEEFYAEARLLPSPSADLIAPDVMPLELSRVMLKKVRRGELSEASARLPIVAGLQFMTFHPSLNLLARAIDISLQHQRDPFDGLYIALALQERCPLVTADRILYDALVSAYPDTLIWVGDLPNHLRRPA
jgi:predicted nucleic acid-binding protein